MERSSTESFLKKMGAGPSAVRQLIRYTKNHFREDTLSFPLHFPLPEEAHVAAWRAYERLATVADAWSVLQQKLVQLQFPIARGIDKKAAYRAATGRGVFPAWDPRHSGLQLRAPQRVSLSLHESVGGVIPVVVAEERHDFVALLQALTLRNQPVDIPDSMGACMIAGYNNWDRVRALRDAWEAESDLRGESRSWQQRFREIVPQKHLYQDRFILLSRSPYSGVPAAQLNLPEDEWLRLSHIIRLEHECTHYFTRRVYGTMRNNLYDELMADMAGLLAATGEFRAAWFLRFMGLENFPEYREGGRLQNYRSDPPLDDAAFRVLMSILKQAADHLQVFVASRRAPLQTLKGRIRLLAAMARLTLPDLAAAEGSRALESAWEALAGNIVWTDVPRREAEIEVPAPDVLSE